MSHSIFLTHVVLQIFTEGGVTTISCVWSYNTLKFGSKIEVK